MVVPSRGGERVTARALAAERPLACTLRLVALLAVGAAVLLWARRAAAESPSPHDDAAPAAAPCFIKSY